MACGRCGSHHQREFSAEIYIHLLYPRDSNTPPILAFPKLLVCLYCGFTSFTVPEGQLRLLAQRIPSHASHSVMVEAGEHLTKRQREVLKLLAEGKMMTEVGSILNIAPRTVAFHKYKLMEKLGLKSGAEITRYAIRNHIVAA
jgi:DNA-binding CsgD family transcriptional regulator